MEAVERVRPEPDSGEGGPAMAEAGGNAEGVCMKSVVIACFCAGAFAVAGCAGGSGLPTSPSATLSASDTAALSASPRTGELHVTKECSQYTGLAGSFCTITSSNVKAIEVGSRVVYARAAGATSLSSDVVLDVPGPGNNKAFGHCALNLLTGLGLCTFSGGTGKFTSFQARADVSPPTDGVNWHWEGTYSFSPQD